MNLPAKVCLGAGAFLAMSGGLLALTGFALGAQTHLNMPFGGGSAVAAIQFLKNYECRSIKLMNILAAPEGIQAVRTAHPDVDIYVAAVDEKLNDHGYIVPGLGDAGDRIFGTK